jgi:hypothetical protein
MSDLAPATEVANAVTDCSTCTDCTAARRAHIENTSARYLIPTLCEQFYDLKWVTGTGGSISIREKYEQMCMFGFCCDSSCFCRLD